MSDTDEKLSKVNDEAARYRHRSKQLKSEKEELLNQIATLKSEFEEYKKTNPYSEEVNTLRQQLLTRDHKEVFVKVAKESKIRPDALEAAWKLSGYEAKGEAREDAIKAVLGDLVKSNAYLLSTEEPVIVEDGPGSSKGGEAGGKFVISRSASAQWLGENQARINKEIAAKNVHYVD